MHVLVTGGTGLVGKFAVDHLLDRGHTVRLFSRDAEHDAAQWPSGVEARSGDVEEDQSVRGAAEGCDAVLHVVGIIDESPPERTFDNINVEGTRRVVREAERAGVRRLVYVSSLGAGTGESEYHRSKRAGEDAVRSFRGEWLIVRPGNVYGPGDEVISLMLKLVRALPVIPTVGDGEQEFQPIWVEDLGEALALALERNDLTGQVLEVAGTERTTTNDLIDRFATLTDKSPKRIPVPEWLASLGTRSAEAVGLSLPINADQITMLQEGSVIEESNALTDVFGVEPTPLAKGLAHLADALPERLPSEGVGPLQHHHFWADIQGSRLDADELFQLVCDEFQSLPAEGLLQVGVEPDTRHCLMEGATLTLWIPLRGHIQVRVEEIANRTATAVTLHGHPLSGVIRFRVQERGPLLRFEILAYTRASNVLDRLAMETFGESLRRVTWTSVVEEVVERSGGKAPEGVQSEKRELEEGEARDVEEWAEALVHRRERREREFGEPVATGPGGD